MNLRNKIRFLFSFTYLFFLSFQCFGVKTTNQITFLSYSPIKSKIGLSSAVDEQGNTWIKGRLPNSLIGVPTLFQIPSVHMSDYELYVYKNGALQRLIKHHDSNKKDIKSRFPIYYFVSEKPEFYINIKDQSISVVDILIKEFGEFGQKASLNVMQISLYYGLAIMSIIFNFVFYTIFRDLRFIIYSLLQLCIFTIFLYEDGMFYYFSGHKWTLPYFLAWNVPICSILAALFTYHFLGLKKNMPHFKKIVIPNIAILFVFALVYTWTGSPVVYTLNNIMWYVLPMVCFYQAIKMFKHDTYARFLIFTFGVLVIVAAGYTLYRQYDSSMFSFFTINTLRLASAIEIIAISFALIFKVRTLREENERYKTELRHYLDLLSLSREIKEEKKKQSLLEPADVVKDKTTESSFLVDDIKELYQLTDREADVLHCIWNGDSNKEIADKLFISVNTTKFHVSRLYAKLDVKNRSQARSLKKNHKLEHGNSEGYPKYGMVETKRIIEESF